MALVERVSSWIASQSGGESPALASQQGAAQMQRQPSAVGILAFESYYPQTYVRSIPNSLRAVKLSVRMSALLLRPSLSNR